MAAVLGYFGPAGTFTHQALQTITAEPSIPFVTVARTLDAVRLGEVEAALVPIENSVEGGVTTTLDNLAAGAPLMIRREVLLPVQFSLCGREGTTLAAVRRILTHPHAAAQCRNWLATNLPEAVIIEGGSTAGAAEEVSSPGSRFDAAVCAPVACRMYGLTELAERIADNAQAVTRFVLVGRPDVPPEPTGRDKTTVVAYMFKDHPGALLEILEQFASRGVNLCRIESRPTKAALGDYCFSIDAEGHVGDPRTREALLGLHRICKKVVFLGSYERADGVVPTIARGFADDDFRDAELWLENLVDPG